MFKYTIDTGAFYFDSAFWGTGYSGAGYTLESGRNNPAMIMDASKGPIPSGLYLIGKPYHHPVEGPLTFNLTPQQDTQEFGRSGFHIHGNDARNNASLGCIILGPAIRAQLAKFVTSGICYLTVIARQPVTSETKVS